MSLRFYFGDPSIVAIGLRSQYLIKRENIQMTRSQIITITGDLGSGKSTVSKILCKTLNYDYIYTGSLQREIARKYNMTTLELNKYAETHPEIDAEIDSTFKTLNKSAELIVDSRLAWFFIPTSFKIFLKTNLAIASERISSDRLRKDEKYTSKEEAFQKIVARKMSENKRYAELYGADCTELSNFDFVIDTSFISVDKVAELIIFAYNLWVSAQEYPKAYISPKNLYPTKSIATMDWGNFDLFSKDDTFPPVSVVCVNMFDFIIDGHKRVSNAIFSKQDAIPAVYKSENDTFEENLSYRQKIESVIDEQYYHEWEIFNKFSFLSYPNI